MLWIFGYPFKLDTTPKWLSFMIKEDFTSGSGLMNLTLQPHPHNGELAMVKHPD